MNVTVFKLFIVTRNFHRSAIYEKVSTQAKFMVKLIGGTSRKKSHRFFLENRSTPALSEFLGQKTGGNVKTANRRVSVLNSVFLERITDLLSSSKCDHNVHQCGFIVTKVKYAHDGAALHVYWCADSDLIAVNKKLPAIGGWLRHELSQLQNGRVPHINFVYDKSTFRATDVEELLKTADFGSEYVSPHPTTSGMEQLLHIPNPEKIKESVLLKSFNVLGIDRDDIIRRVLEKMHHVPEPTRVEPSSYSDPQRRIDFKKYLKEQEISKAKIERRNSKQMLLDMMSLTRKKEEDFFDEENMSLEEDYFDDEEEIIEPPST